jgi:hypothetical protein
MASDSTAFKIDLAIEQLARENPGRIFQDGNTGVIQISTCTDTPARYPLTSKPSDINKSIYVSIYNWCIDSTALPRKNVVADAATLYGRSVRWVEHVLSTITRST